MKFDENLGQRLKKIRQMRRISQEHLGELLGVSFQQIQKYESGANRICPEKLDKCSKSLNIPVGYFFGGDDMPANIFSYNKRTLTIATTIADLPSDEVAKRLYQLALSISDELNMAKEQALRSLSA